jgi:hypothetical protein
LRVEALLLEVASALDTAGVEHRVLKGVALAHTTYPDPAWRVFGDVDVLVRPHAFTTAVELLGTKLHLERKIPELRRGFDARFGKEALLRAEGRPELDLHRTFVEGALGLTIHLPDLFAPGRDFVLGGRRLTALPAPQQLLHAAYTAVVGDRPPRLSALRDVLQVLQEEQPAADETLELARRWRCQAVLARGISSAWKTLAPRHDAPPLIRWAQSYRPAPMERLLAASHVGPARAYTRHAAALLVVPGLDARLAYLRAIAWPQRRYLAARGLPRVGFPVRLWRRARPWVARAVRRL